MVELEEPSDSTQAEESKSRPGWYRSPTSLQALTPQHDRAILSLDINVEGTRAVTASADHGLRLYDLQSGEQIRQLFN